MTKIFINLTNGLEIFRKNKLINLENVSFLRIQSTWCEQKRWNDILFSLSDDFLMNVAIGNDVIVIDATVERKKGKPSRAIWQGLSFIKFVLNEIWFDGKKEIILNNRVKSSKQYFKQEFLKLENKTKKRIEYYKKFLFIDKIDNISSLELTTDLDGDYDKFREILKNLLL